jgi:hypothetical protein
VRLSEELARILPRRGRRRPPEQAPREIVPSPERFGDGRDAARLDAARDRLRAEIPPRTEDD